MCDINMRGLMYETHKSAQSGTREGNETTFQVTDNTVFGASRPATRRVCATSFRQDATTSCYIYL